MIRTKGIVRKSTGSWYKIKHEDEIFDCKIRGKFRIQGIRTTNPIAVGDIVDFEMHDGEETGTILKIHDRKNSITRKSTNLSKKSQIIATNIDFALLVVTMADPRTELRFMDRFLVAAEAYKIPVKIVFNKTDLHEEEEDEDMLATAHLYQQIGYECFSCSSTERTGVNEIIKAMAGKVCVLSGNSGVGKSTLINAIDPSLDLRIGEISDVHFKGKHTTTFAEMFDLEGGAMLIDTPGIKSFGMLDMEREEICHYFPEMFKLLDGCKFYNCTHTHEPGCAVKAGIDEHLVSASRYDSYLHILDGDDNTTEKYRGNGY